MTYFTPSSRRLSVGALLLALAAFLLAPAGARAQNPVVLELFTSQGCSSCPPADRLMGKLAGKPGVIVLSLPVDYWDYLGWKDTLASPDYSARQRQYARLRGDRSVYTPQVVINGRRHAVGSNETQVLAGIREDERRNGGLPVSLKLKIDSDTLSVSAGKAPDRYVGERATLWLVSFAKRTKVAIGRGENRGRTVTYINVVRRMQPIGMWKGAAIHVDLPKSEIMKNGVDGCAVLLQLEKNGKPGAIIGAAMMPDL